MTKVTAEEIAAATPMGRWEKLTTRKCADCGEVGFAGPFEAETCSECDLAYFAGKATEVYGGGGLTVMKFEL